MDRSEALLLYVAAVVAVINAAMLAYWPYYRQYGPGPWLGLYALSYMPAAYFARPRNRRLVWAIAWAIMAAFIGYSLWIIYQAIAG